MWTISLVYQQPDCCKLSAGIWANLRFRVGYEEKQLNNFSGIYGTSLKKKRPELKKAMWVSEKLLKKVEQVSIHILLLTEGLKASSSGLEKRHLVQLRKEAKD